MVVVGVLLALKMAVHAFHFEFLILDTLFSSIVASTIFVIGFLLTSILPDYKEAEKIPAQIRTALEGIHDDVATFAYQQPEADIHAVRATLLEIVALTYKGLGSEGHHAHLETAISKCDVLVGHFARLDRLGMPNNYIARLRNGLDSLRIALYRISYIQKIEFVPSVHVLINTLVFADIFLLLFLKTDGSWGSALIFSLVSYLFVFALHLMNVFEQPFRQGVQSADTVSLYLLRDFSHKLEAMNSGPANTHMVTALHAIDGDRASREAAAGRG